MTYSIEIKSSAEKELRELPKPISNHARAIIAALAGNPRPHGCKKLRGTDRRYRIRISDWRVIYEIFDDRLIVYVVAVTHRGKAYR